MSGEAGKFMAGRSFQKSVQRILMETPDGVEGLATGGNHSTRRISLRAGLDCEVGPSLSDFAIGG
jgi:hypothetical protein